MNILRPITINVFKPIFRPRFSSGHIGTRFQSTGYSTKCEGILVEPKDQVLWLKFNRPQKYNALTLEMYDCITDSLNKVNKDESIKAVVLTGTGDYYSSGNDLNNILLAMKDEKGSRAGLTKSKDVLVRFVNSFINLEKFLIAAVNGPAVGITVTTLALCDYVIASEKATFTSPFTSLGLCPEACSSITFPRIMGRSRASELLLLNKIWNSSKAQSYGLVSEVVEHDKFNDHLQNLLYGKQGLVSNCYPQSLKVSKALVQNDKVKQELLDTNQRESDVLLNCWFGEECTNAMQKFFQRSKK